MNEDIDYILVEEANTVNYSAMMEQVKCVFIGTKKYFFVIPFNIVNFTPGYTTDTTETTEMYFAGMPLQEYLINKCAEKGQDITDFENYLIEQGFTGVNIIDIENDINQFKVQTGFFATGIMYNKKESRTGWKIILNRFKKDKARVAAFYSNHPKRVEK